MTASRLQHFSHDTVASRRAIAYCAMRSMITVGLLDLDRFKDQALQLRFTEYGSGLAPAQ